MEGYRETLLSRASRVIPGTTYNDFLEEMRNDDATNHVLFYEIVLLENQPWEYLRDRTYPALARYLKMKSFDPETGKGVVISLFFQDRCYLIACPDFLKAFRELEGLNSSAFHFRVLRWLSQDGA
jgi:hypothetical protein